MTFLQCFKLQTGVSCKKVIRQIYKNFLNPWKNLANNLNCKTLKKWIILTIIPLLNILFRNLIFSSQFWYNFGDIFPVFRQCNKFLHFPSRRVRFRKSSRGTLANTRSTSVRNCYEKFKEMIRMVRWILLLSGNKMSFSSKLSNFSKKIQIEKLTWLFF